MPGLFIVDAFADRPFTGNPAAVCLLDRERETGWLQTFAAEMNLSETAYVLPRSGGGGWDLRWFTPRVEVDLCGHATLASAHVLWESGRLGPDEPAVFRTRSGRLTCRRTTSGIEMDFPAEAAVESPAPEHLLTGLNVEPVFVGRNRMDWLVVVATEDEVRRVTPDYVELEKVETRGIIVTARSQGEFDFVSRAFFPRCGVPEDPVCGSAHCCLGPYWSGILDRTSLRAWQASPRGGVVQIRCEGARVILSGKAVTTVRGELAV